MAGDHVASWWILVVALAHRLCLTATEDHASTDSMGNATTSLSAAMGSRVPPISQRMARRDRDKPVVPAMAKGIVSGRAARKRLLRVRRQICEHQLGATDSRSGRDAVGINCLVDFS